MSSAAPLQTATAKPLQTAGAHQILQRKCECGAGASNLTGECAECSKKKMMGLQTKLRVNEPGDAYEQEADRVAEQVLAKPTHSNVSSTPLRIQRYTGQANGQAGAAPASVDHVLASAGRPLEPALRQDMEQRFGHDFSRVRVHSSGAAEQSAREVNADAFTVGHDIVFGAVRYAPGTSRGNRLLAHELTHTLQQRGGDFRLQRFCTEEGECDGDRGSVATRSSAQVGAPEFLEPGWSDVNDGGVIYKEGKEDEGGANLRPSPKPGAEPHQWLPQNTKVHILKHHRESRWYAVVAMSKDRGKVGYIADWLVARNPPDPNAGIVKIKSGDTPLEIAGRYYSNQGFDVWSKDKRYVVNALLYVNERAKHNFKGSPVIEKRGVKTEWINVEGGSGAPWWTTQVRAGGYLWLPGADYLDAIYEEVASKEGTGSITGDLWRKVKKLYHYAAYGLAFAGGLIHGFSKSLWDALAGLAELIGGVLKSIFTLNVIADVRELGSAIGKMTWEDIKQALGTWADSWAEKLNSDSPWVAGHAHGYLTGYVMAEAAMLLMSGGTLAAAKQAVWGSRLGKALQETRAFQTFVKGVEKVGEVSGKARTAVKAAIEATEKGRLGTVVKAARVTGRVITWTATGLRKILSLPEEIVRYLIKPVIAQLRRLEPWFDRIAELSKRAKRWLFGCASPCKVDVEIMRNRLKSMTNADIERFVDEIDEAAKVPKVKGGKIEDRRVPTGKVRRMEAEDIPRLTKTESLGQVKARIQTVIGKTIADDPAIRQLWDEAAAEVMRGKRLTKDNAAIMYDRTRNKFWKKVRNNPDRFRHAGFAFPRSEQRAPYLGGMRKNVPDAEFTISLDHSAEKAIANNWKLALDPTNLVYEFAAPNSWREIVQMRHPMLRP